jgi:predicted TIM-barrel fold metal-dependent hydrolase
VAAAGQQNSVPWSAGKELPKTAAPAKATDCHHHIYNPRFPVDPKATLRPGAATAEDYRKLQKRLGISRNVVVQPSTYGTDNRCLLDALEQFGLSATRGVAVVNSGVSDAELKQMDGAGVRGIRFNLIQAGATTLDMVEPLAKQITPLGWHIQVNMSPQQTADAAALWRRLPCPIVFDHLGHVLPRRDDDQAFGVISALLQKGHGWVKLSGVYIDSRLGSPTYADSGSIAKAYIKEAPERLVWASDWPHPSVETKPDDAILFDLLAEWAPDEEMRRRILVDNPGELYGFS